MSKPDLVNNTYRYLLTPWIWQSGEEESWTQPPGVVAALDLRPKPARAAKGGTPQGFMLAVMDTGTSVPRGSVELGLNSLSSQLTSKQDADLISALDLSAGDLGRENLARTLYGLFTDLAEPSGANRNRPLAASHRGFIQLWMNGTRLVRERFSETAHPWMLDHVRADAQKLRAEGGDHYRRFLHVMRLKYGFTNERILPGEKELPFGTTFADDFTEASNTTLASHTPTGTNAGTSWTQLDGTFQVLASADAVDPTANYTTFPGMYVMDDAFSVDDMDVEVDEVTDPGTTTRFGGPATMCAAASEDCYYGRVRRSGSDADIEEINSGTNSDLTTGTWTVSYPVNVRLRSDGNSHTLFIDDVSTTGPTSDTSHSGNVRSGICGHQTGGSPEWRVDNFQAVDIVGAAATLSVNLVGSGGLAGTGGLAGRGGGLAG